MLGYNVIVKYFFFSIFDLFVFVLEDMLENGLNGKGCLLN